ncbi:MAG: hypothetical protein JO227_10945 [Acetobacteraceae bacterium]|nr:hypothetical protein [Acetobacteraceae bacterium]
MALLCLLCAAPGAVAAPPGQRDPDWPCQQIKVPELSLAGVWSGPGFDPQQIDWKQDSDVADLVQRVAPRREPINQAESLIHDFAQRAGEQRQTKLLAVLSGIFSELSGERDSVIAGLDRFGRRQKELAAQIRQDNDKLHALQTDSTSDANAVERMTEQVKWEAEVFQDRRQALSYACDVPAKIEQRLYGLAQAIQRELG